ncbi:acyltransferase family protein [Gordonia sp. (in: high G+C Gram-positive bacteria)]|uniref:acyltransferase family protein n=1 Tax=Gordonia sp. (in: high G+C Gram-positive bacteria) TaxID=84139 RepID=UPI0039E4C31B
MTTTVTTPRGLDAAELDRLTGDTRDRAVDVLRLASLLVVVAGHSIMLTVAPPAPGGDRLVLGNLLGDHPLLQVATWLLQVLPLFFFAGAAAAVYGWRPDTAPGHWLFRRSQRLLRPVFWYLLAVGAALGVAEWAGSAAAVDVIARLGVQLLWFLGAYLVILAVVALLQWMSTPAQIVGAVTVCYALTGLADFARLRGDGTPAWTTITFATAWTIPAILGIAHAKKLITPKAAALGAALMLAVDTALVVFGPYDVSMVTVPGQRLSNMSPPSLLLAGHAIVLCLLAIAGAGALGRWARRPRVWWWVALGNRSAMTLYLWHLPLLGLIIGAGALLGFTRDHPASGEHLVVVAVQTVALLVLLVPVVAVLSPLENRPLPWWDDPRATRLAPTAGHRLRDVVVLLLMVLAGAALLMFARDGMLVGAPMLGVVAAGAIGARIITAPVAQPAGQQR